MFREQRSQVIAEKLRDIWENNYLANKRWMLAAEDIERNVMPEGPNALVVGAGPSLAKNIGDIDHSLYDIITCDKSVARLVERDIVPEYVVALNAEPTPIKEWLKPMKGMIGSTLIMPCGVHPDTYSEWDGHLQWINAIVPTGLHERVLRETKLMPRVIGSNSGTFGFLMAVALRYKRVAYIGMDFSFLTRDEVTRKYDFNEYDPPKYNIVEMTDVNGDVRWLDLGWWDMAQAFQGHVKKASEMYGTETFACTEGGINYSDACQQMTLKEFNKYLRGEEDEVSDNGSGNARD